MSWQTPKFSEKPCLQNKVESVEEDTKVYLTPPHSCVYMRTGINTHVYIHTQSLLEVLKEEILGYRMGTLEAVLSSGCDWRIRILHCHMPSSSLTPEENMGKDTESKELMGGTVSILVRCSRLFLKI